jgi:hypothetical protein
VVPEPPDDDSGFRCADCLRLLTRAEMARGLGVCGGCEDASLEPPMEPEDDRG